MLASLLAALSLVAGAPTSCAAPADDPLLAEADGYYLPGEHRIVMRAWVCRALVDGRRQRWLLVIGGQLEQALYVFAHEREHARGELDECEADRKALRALPAVAQLLGFGRAAGVRARRVAVTGYLHAGHC
jgi:hypothetical protein